MAAVSREIVVDVAVERFFDLVDRLRSVPRVRARHPRVPREGHRRRREGRRVRARRGREDNPVRPPPRRGAAAACRLVARLRGHDEGVERIVGVSEDAGGKTRARYTVDIQIAKPPLVPQAIIDRVADELTRVQLPRTLEAFKRRAEG